MPTDGDSSRETRPRSMEFVPDQRPKHDVPLRVALVNDEDAAFTAWVAQICDHPVGQALSLDEKSGFAWEVTEAKTRGLAAWGKFQALFLVLSGKVARDVVNTRWVLTGTDLAGKRTVSAGLVTRGPQDPVLVAGPVDTSSCVRLRSPHLQVISLSALKKWKMWSLDIKNALLQLDPLPREVYLQALSEWCPRAWCLNAPAYELNDAPVEFPQILKRYLVEFPDSLKWVGSRCDPCPYTAFTGSTESVGTFSLDIDDTPGCGAPGVLDCPWQHLEWWGRRKGLLAGDENLLCQCKMGELGWSATISRPDIGVRSIQLSSKVNALQGSNIHWINAWIKSVNADHRARF